VHFGWITDDLELLPGTNITVGRLGPGTSAVNATGETALAKAAYLQNELICLEMLVAAFALDRAFSFRDFADDIRSRRPLLENLAEVLDAQDVLADAHQTFILPKQVQRAHEMGAVGPSSAGGRGGTLVVGAAVGAAGGGAARWRDGSWGRGKAVRSRDGRAPAVDDHLGLLDGAFSSDDARY
jgi:hypothetical protein